MITIYTKENCAGCLMAEEIMKENNIKFNEVSITPDTIEKFDLTCAPTIMKDDKRLDGYPGSEKLLKFLQD